MYKKNDKNKYFLNLKKDWRYQGQDEYLQDVDLIYSKYNDSDGDHDHCEFCSIKISKYFGDLNDGYCTIDRYYWICETCFNDFKEMFKWTVVNK